MSAKIAGAKHLRDEPDADRPERPKVPRVTSAKSAVDCLNRIHDSDGSIWVDSNREFDTFITHGDEKEVRSLAREMKGMLKEQVEENDKLEWSRREVRESRTSSNACLAAQNRRELKAVEGVTIRLRTAITERDALKKELSQKKQDLVNEIKARYAEVSGREMLQTERDALKKELEQVKQTLSQKCYQVDDITDELEEAEGELQEALSKLDDHKAIQSAYVQLIDTKIEEVKAKDAEIARLNALVTRVETENEELHSENDDLMNLLEDKQERLEALEAEHKQPAENKAPEQTIDQLLGLRLHGNGLNFERDINAGTVVVLAPHKGDQEALEDTDPVWLGIVKGFSMGHQVIISYLRHNVPGAVYETYYQPQPTRVHLEGGVIGIMQRLPEGTDEIQLFFNRVREFFPQLA